jgi:hypothetical protein
VESGDESSLANVKDLPRRGVESANMERLIRGSRPGQGNDAFSPAWPTQQRIIARRSVGLLLKGLSRNSLGNTPNG